MNELINLGNGAMVKVTMLKGQKGDDIQNIAKTSTSGLVDTYTITLTDGSTHNFTITNGNGIVSITKTSTVGLVDTYTITYQDGQTSTFTVTNGSNGQDVGSSNLATVELGQNSANNYAIGEYLIYNSLFCKAIAPITVGDAFTLGTNIEQTTIGDEIEITNVNIATTDQKASNALSDIAVIETNSTASKSYEVGENLIYNSLLYVVIQPIVVGASLVENVNISRTTVIDELAKANFLQLIGTTKGQASTNITQLNALRSILRQFQSGSADNMQKMHDLVVVENSHTSIGVYQRYIYRIGYPDYGSGKYTAVKMDLLPPFSRAMNYNGSHYLERTTIQLNLTDNGTSYRCNGYISVSSGGSISGGTDDSSWHNNTNATEDYFDVYLMSIK